MQQSPAVKRQTCLIPQNLLDKHPALPYNIEALLCRWEISHNRCGGIAQLARAFGSYPKGHVFESHLRYQIANTVNQIYKNRVY